MTLTKQCSQPLAAPMTPWSAGLLTTSLMKMQKYKPMIRTDRNELVEPAKTAKAHHLSCDP